jgi:hypothetical protein
LPAADRISLGRHAERLRRRGLPLAPPCQPENAMVPTAGNTQVACGGMLHGGVPHAASTPTKAVRT